MKIGLTREIARKWVSAATCFAALFVFAGCGKFSMSIGAIDVPSSKKVSLKLSTNSISTAEGSVETLALTLSQARSVPTIAKLQLESPREDQNLDFNSVAATVTIPAGATSAAIPLTVVDDVIYEGLEDFTITVTSDDDDITVSNANVLNILVADNEATPSITVGSSAENILESTSSGTVTLTMSPPSSQSVMVNYSVTPAGATSGSDYSLSGGIITFAPGETSKSISYTILQDSATEAAESFTVALTTIAGTALLGTPSSQTVTIVDDDSPNLFINNVTVTEGGNAVFTVSLSAASTQTITFDWVTSNGTAVSGTDYTASGQTESIAPGVTSKTITVPTLNAVGICESDKSFTVGLSNPTNASIADGSGTGTIQDDDLPSLSVAAGTGDEGDTITHTVTLTPVCPTRNVSFNWSTSHVSTSAADLTVVTSQSRTLNAGQTTASLSVATTEDTLDEDNEQYTVTLASPGNATLGAASASGTITDNDASPTISIANATVAEGNGAGNTSLVFTVTASAVSGRTINFNWQTTDGTSTTADNDYVTASSSGAIAAGSTTGTITVNVVKDLVHENDETVNVTLSGGSGYTAIGSTLSAQGTITNDDAAPTLTVSDVTVTEGTGAGSTTATVTVTASAVSALPIVVNYVTSNGTATTADSDYVSVSNALTIPAGQLSQTFTFTIVHDAKDEDDEMVNVTLSGGSGYTSAGSDLTGTVTITDDDNAPTISIADVTVTEGTNASPTTMTFTVTPSIVSGKVITFDLGSTNGTAVAGTDFTAPSGTVTLAANAASVTFNVSVTADAMDEDDETFNVVLSGGANYTSAGSDLSAVATITDDDSPPTISIADVTIAEGTSGSPTTMTFTVTPSVVSSKAISFAVSSTDGTAVAGTDFTAPSGTVTIPANAASVTFNVSVAADALDEDDETFSVVLSGGSNYTVAGSDLSATATITDDDNAPTISIADVTVSEGTGGAATTMTFTVTPSAVSSKTITFSISSTNVTALAGTDFTAPSGLVAIPAGSSSTQFIVDVTADALDEFDETFNVVLSGGSNYTSAGSDLSAVATITDDDAAPTISIADVTLTEGTGAATSMTFTVTPSAVSGKNITFTVASTNGTAIAGTDFTAPSGTVTLNAGATSVTFNVSVTADSMDEYDETFTVNLSGGSNYTSAGSDLSSAATITDDDAPPTISIANSTVTEGSNLVFVVTLSAVSGKNITGNVTPSDNGATSTLDYNATPVAFAINAGSTSENVLVPTVDDVLFCEATEGVTASLDTLVNVTLGTPATASGSIMENDFPKLSIAPSVVTLTEGGSQLFTVTADQTCPQPMKFTYQTVPISADTGSDFPNQGAELTIAPGDTTATFTINTTDDSIKELQESLAVTAAPYTSGYTSAQNGANIARIDLTDNDSAGAVYKVATSQGNTCAVSTAGELRCWGENFDGQLGMTQSPKMGDEPNEMGDFLAPVNLGLIGMEKVLAATAGEQHTCTIVGTTLPGDVKCFGYGGGRLGLNHTNTTGDQVSDMGPYVVGPPESGLKTVNLGTRTAKAIAAGALHTCIIDNNNKITCWGGNSSGELGRGNTAVHGHLGSDMGASLLDVNLSSTHTVALEITAGENFNCAIIATTPLATSGPVKCWGNNSDGQLGIGSTSNRGNSATTLGDYNDNGTPLTAADDIGIAFVNLGTGRTAKRISAGTTHVCAILDNDRVKCWGDNAYANLGLGHTSDMGDQLTELGDYNDGGTPGVFTDDVGLPYVDLGTDGSSNPLTASDIATTSRATCALTNLGVKCWGRVSSGYGVTLTHLSTSNIGDSPSEMGDGNPVRSIGWPGAETTVDISAAGDYRMCAKSSIGTLKCWGSNDSGQQGQGHVSAITTEAVLAATPVVNLGSLETVASMAISSEALNHICAVLSSGSLKCWGWRLSGALGDGMDNYGDDAFEMGAHMVGNYASGKMNLGGLAVKDVKLGQYFICALFDNDNGACWGNVSGNEDLQGVTSTYVGEVQADWPPPLFKIPAARKILSLAVSESSTVCALFDDFSSSCWGNGGYKLGVATSSGSRIGDSPSEVGENLAFHNLGTDRKAVKISHGINGVCALLDNLTVKCWGGNTNGALGQEITGPGLNWGLVPGSMGDNIPPIKLGTGTLARDITASNNSVCTITTTNLVKCWGSNGTGDLLQGNTTARGTASGQMGDAIPTSDLGTGLHALKLSPSGGGYCALLNDFTVKCWGNGGSGRLGQGSTGNLGHTLGTTGDGLPVVSLASGYTVRDIHSTYMSNCALLENNSDHSTKIQCWGHNLGGALGLGDISDRGDNSSEMGDNLPFVDVGF